MIKRQFKLESTDDLLYLRHGSSFIDCLMELLVWFVWFMNSQRNPLGIILINIFKSEIKYKKFTISDDKTSVDVFDVCLFIYCRIENRIENMITVKWLRQNYVERHSISTNWYERDTKQAQIQCWNCQNCVYTTFGRLSNQNCWILR